MADKQTAVRLQVYVTSRRTVAALEKEAKAGRISLSQAAGRMIERGLRRTVTTDPADQLLAITRTLQDHRRATAQDLMLLQEMAATLLREMFLRMPATEEDADPLRRAAGEARLEAVLDDAAERIVRGERRMNGRNGSAAHDRVPEAAE